MLDEIALLFSQFTLPQIFSSSISSFLVIFAAEIGDKSQLVCMTLAARYRAKPVLFGAILAFIALNSIAVLFGASIAATLPKFWLSLAVALLFFLFAYHSFQYSEQEDSETITVSYKHLLGATFLMITLAEFGDKTQLAVVALSSHYQPLGVWLGATLALIAASVMGVWLGRKALQRIPTRAIHKLSAGLFFIMALVALYYAKQYV